MSEPKLISPLLDNIAMGAPISDHNGVRCCPAMAKDSDDKYIVKIISVPASQVQLDALLLTGAYSDAAAARRYFKELAEGVTEEAKLLQTLSQAEGFLSYDSWQIVPMDDGTGFDIYLLGSYKRSLERYCRRNTMTQLGAVNLGMDLCAALERARQAGYLYVDLKPGNVFMTDSQEYRIGDLGFLNQSSLKYASLPDKYRSAYTPPEITDAFSALNDTLDVYAVGMILYEIFNGGVLPPEKDTAPTEPLPTPLYADYEMAEIIAKACAPDPAQRWQNPVRMGKALVSYMQRNGANDVPIVPPPAELPLKPAFEKAEATEEVPQVLPEAEAEEAAPALPEETPAEEPAPEAAETEEPALYEDDLGNLSFLSYLTNDETAPELDGDPIYYDEVTTEVSDMLTQADDLLSHPTPDPVIPPDPIDVPVPPPIRQVKEDVSIPESEPEETETEEAASEEPEVPEAPETEETPEKVPEEPKKKSSKGLIRGLIVLLVLLLVVAAGTLGVYYYRNYYLLPIQAITLDGNETTLVVRLNTDIDDDLLTVVCEDTYRNRKYAPVVDGVATFTDLSPKTAYTISVEIDGFHKLTGQTTGAYTTPAQTNIVQFSAVTGTEGGSAIISFNIDGQDSDQWQILCTTEGESDRTVTFSNHMTTLTGLTVGKTYTLQLTADSPLYLTGVNEITFTASDLVFAQNLHILECANGVLTAGWTAPEDTEVGSWTVHCYSDNGYDETVNVTETTVIFQGIDAAAAYTVEVTAANMSMSERTYISENSLTVSNFQTSATGPNSLSLTWQASSTPVGGWILTCTVGGSGISEVITCEDASAVIDPVIPNTTYQFSLQAVDGATVLDGVYTYIAPEGRSFSGYGVTASKMRVTMYRTPDIEGWDRKDVSAEDETNRFVVGEGMSFVIRLPKEFDSSKDKITALYVIRDENGLPVATATKTATWNSMWDGRYGTFDVPKLPSTPGSYTISIYFNGMVVAGSLAFTLTAA